MISAVTEDPMFALIIAHDSEAGSAREGHCPAPCGAGQWRRPAGRPDIPQGSELRKAVN